MQIGIQIRPYQSCMANPIRVLVQGAATMAWYDPSDLSTMFQDTAGTTPVTAAGQSVALIRDKSGFGNHATQTTAGSRPTYQNSGGLHWLAFDGTDDFLVTSTITPAVDKIQMITGVQKLSDAAIGVLVEHGNATAGTAYIAAPLGTGASGDFAFWSQGATAAGSLAGASVTLAPTTRVITGLGDIAGDSRIIRRDGVQRGSDAGDQGTGNYTAQILYIGRRGGTTLPFNGNLYGLVVRYSSANLDAAQITAAERWVGTKTGVAIP